MILSIDSANAGQHADLLDEMFKVRADVFEKRLNWDVKTINGREIDEFDDQDPTYVISLCDKTGEFRGSVRLLKTTGPNMLSDVFADLLGEQPKIADPLILESSRFSIRTDMVHQSCSLSGDSPVQQTTVELLLGLIEASQRVGATQIVSVFDARMARLFRRLDCAPDPVGTPQRFGKAMAYAGLFDATDEQWQRVAANAGIESSVIGERFTFMPPVIAPMQGLVA